MEARAKEAESSSRLTQMQALKKEADAKLDLAQKRMERAKSLIARNTITKDEFQLQESEVLQAEAAVEAARS